MAQYPCWIKIYLTVLMLAASSIGLASEEPEASQATTVLMVSFDGFRADYARRWQLHNFMGMSEQGISAASLVPQYPSKTFPNHYSMVTGLPPGEHGLVDNTFYAPVLQSGYRVNDRSAVENPAFYGGLPLWQYLQEFGFRTASYFWVGSEAPVNGRMADYFQLYDGTVPDETRIATVLDWLKLPAAEKPQFVTLYFSLVDDAAHAFGPDSPEAEIAARTADSLLGILQDGLAQLANPVNLVVVSDHGMLVVTGSADYQIGLDNLNIPGNGVIAVNGQTQVMLYETRPGSLDQWLSSQEFQSGHFNVYRKALTPPHWQYRNHANIGDVILSAQPGYVFVSQVHDIQSGSMTGVHGYDPELALELHGIFYASGPAFIAGKQLPSISNLAIAPLITYLMQVPPLPGNQPLPEVLLQSLRSQ